MGNETALVTIDSQTTGYAAIVSLPSVRGAFGDDEGDVVVLLGGAETLDLVDDCCEGLFGGPCLVLL